MKASLSVNFERFTLEGLSYNPGIVKLCESPGISGGLPWINYDSPCPLIGNVTEVVLPERVPSFPIVKGSMELGITAIDEVGNESDMMIFATPFQFSVPDAPTSPRLETLKEYHICQGSSDRGGDRKSENDITGLDLEGESDNQEVG